MSDLFTNRAAEKARSRERDEERMRRGEVTPSQLQQGNLVFRGFKKGALGLPAKYMNSHASTTKSRPPSGYSDSQDVVPPASKG